MMFYFIGAMVWVGSNAYRGTGYSYPGDAHHALTGFRGGRTQ